MQGCRRLHKWVPYSAVGILASASVRQYTSTTALSHATEFELSVGLLELRLKAVSADFYERFDAFNHLPEFRFLGR
jgi:hypothetical protein